MMRNNVRRLVFGAVLLLVTVLCPYTHRTEVCLTSRVRRHQVLVCWVLPIEWTRNGDDARLARIPGMQEHVWRKLARTSGCLFCRWGKRAGATTLVNPLLAFSDREMAKFFCSLDNTGQVAAFCALVQTNQVKAADTVGRYFQCNP